MALCDGKRNSTAKLRARFVAYLFWTPEMNFWEREKVCKPIPSGVKFFSVFLYLPERVAVASRKNIST